MIKSKPGLGLALAFLMSISLLLAACGDNTATNTAAPAATTAAPAATTARPNTAAATTAAATTAAATTAAATTAAATTAAATTAAATTAAATTAAATTAAAASGGAKPTKVVVGSKNFTESILVGEMYALALEQAGIPVERKLNLGATDVAQAAMVKGDLGLYPEYTGTALLNVLKAKPESNDPKAVYDQVQKAYASQFKFAVLDAAPFNDTNAIVVTKAVADKYNLKTLSDLSKVAGELRFAAIADFVGPRSDTDGLGSLQKTYGGFQFKEVKQYEIPLKYKALQSGQADAAVAFSTDGEISGYGFVLLDDDKHNFPPYQVAPIVRQDVLDAFPNIKTVLAAVSAKLTNDKISSLNWKVDGPDKMEAADVAKAFLKQEGVLK